MSLTIDDPCQRSRDRRRTSHAAPARSDHTGLGPVCATFFGARLVACASVAPGGILSPGPRTVTVALRMMGLAMERHFTNYLRVLNRVT
jgi:hypothetical protein